MPTSEALTVTFDGVNDVPRLTGQSPVEWFSKGMGYYNVYYSGPADTFIATANLTGTDWKMNYLRLSGDDHITTIQDMDSGGGRKIKFLELGYNSDVDLISTRVQFVYGWDGAKHDVQLGAGSTNSVTLYATENIVKTGDGWVGNILTGGKDTILISDAGAGSIKTGDGNASVITNAGWVDSIVTGAGNDTIVIGAGNAGTLNTRGGNDTVDATAAWVEFISTGSGNDVVTLGANAGGMTIRLGSGDDRVKISEMAVGQGVQVHGQSGNDTVDFSGFTSGVTFTLDGNGIFQNLTDPGGLGGLGWVSEVNTNNITGTNKGDALTGDSYGNRLTGRGGNDRLTGGNGNDKLLGGNGNDRLLGGNGRDTLEGGTGRDILVGGKGIDFLRGNGGADVFVFGKGSGADRVRDFADGTDMLRLLGHTGGFGDLTIADSGDNLSITHDGGVIILIGYAETILTAADFDFV